MKETMYSIRMDQVKKSYKIYADKPSSLKERWIGRYQNGYDTKQVLNGVTFDILKGQCVGLIGKNGCGKSTLLKLMTKIIKPSEGELRIRGKVSSLIELGAGFHPDMTGRENVYINASIYGMSRREIEDKMQEIIAFSELEEYMDNPIRTYSSGMYMRLAFAVAINVSADILLIDEILAVGDVNFQKKCFLKLKELKAQGKTIVIVSHDIMQLYELCDRLIWIQDGCVKEEGIAKVVGTHYLDNMEDERIARLANESLEQFQDELRRSILELGEQIHPEARRAGSGEVRFSKVELMDAEGNTCRIFNTGDTLVLTCGYVTDAVGIKVNFNMDFVKDNWQYCYGSCFTKAGDVLPTLNAQGEVTIRIDRLMLLPGRYYLDIGINGENGELYDNVRNVYQITIRDYVHDEFGPCTFEHQWSIK